MVAELFVGQQSAIAPLCNVEKAQLKGQNGRTHCRSIIWIEL